MGEQASVRAPRALLAACAGAALGLALAPREAAAYIDPGAGSMIVQGLIAAAVGAGVAVRLRWRQIKARLSGTRDDGENAEADGGR